MKIAFEEEKVNMMLVMLNKLKVEGIGQAGLLVSINNILTAGEPIVENEDKKGDN